MRIIYRFTILFLSIFICQSWTTVALCFPDKVTPKDYKKIFKMQTQVYTKICVVKSPYISFPGEWSLPLYQTGRLHSDRQKIVVAFVAITPSLLDAALDYWAYNRKDLTPGKIAEERNKIKKMFLLKEQRAFLMIAIPNITRDGWAWRAEIPALNQGIKLISLDGKIGKVTRFAPGTRCILEYDSPPIECFFWVQDVVDYSKDPSFFVQLTNVHFYNRCTKDYKWAKSKQPLFAEVQYETTEVNLLAMLRDSVSAKVIEEKYIEPRMMQADSSIDGAIIGQVISVAIRLLMKILFKI